MFEFIKENVEVIIASTSILIAIIALGFSIWQGRKTINHNIISVRPHLDVISEFDTQSKSINFSIINNGLGPAIIDKIIISAGDNKLKEFSREEFVNFFKSAGLPKIIYALKFNKAVNNYVISPDRESNIFSLYKIEELKKFVEELYVFYQKINIVIEYRSFYNESYTANSSLYDKT